MRARREAEPGKVFFIRGGKEMERPKGGSE